MSGLSDYNENGSASVKLSEGSLFADLNMSLAVHPNKKDIIPLTDLAAIKQSVRNLVLTNKGEKVFRSDIGCNITDLLFDNYNNVMALRMKSAIKRTLNKFEPRIENITVQITPTPDYNAVAATIGFKLNNQNREFDLEFALNRTR